MQFAKNLKKTLVYRNGFSPLGLLRTCLDYALNDNTKITGVFEALKEVFKVEGARDFLTVVSNINNFRNTYVAHQEKELKDVNLTKANLEKWIAGLYYIYFDISLNPRIPCSLFIKGDVKESDNEYLKVLGTFKEMLDSMGFSIVKVEPPIVGSLFQRFSVRFKKQKTLKQKSELLNNAKKAAARVGKELEEGVDIAKDVAKTQYIKKPQSESDKNLADGISIIIDSVNKAGYVEAAFQIGSILIAHSEKDGQKRLAVKTLNQNEIASLEKRNELGCVNNLFDKMLQSSSSNSITSAEEDLLEEGNQSPQLPPAEPDAQNDSRNNDIRKRPGK